jgi:hypothetical protein
VAPPTIPPFKLNLKPVVKPDPQQASTNPTTSIAAGFRAMLKSQPSEDKIDPLRGQSRAPQTHHEQPTQDESEAHIARLLALKSPPTVADISDAFPLIPFIPPPIEGDDASLEFLPTPLPPDDFDFNDLPPAPLFSDEPIPPPESHETLSVPTSLVGLTGDDEDADDDDDDDIPPVSLDRVSFIGSDSSTVFPPPPTDGDYHDDPLIASIISRNSSKSSAHLILLAEMTGITHLRLSVGPFSCYVLY